MPDESRQHALELVTVLEVYDSFALGLAKASLDDAEIPYVIRGEILGDYPGIPGALGRGLNPLWKCFCQIQVTPEFESEARNLLEPLQQ